MRRPDDLAETCQVFLPSASPPGRFAVAIPHLRNGVARRRVLKPRRRACLIFARLPASSKGDGTARPGAWSAGSLGCLVYAAVTA
jgi:hypothetical protein